jgi:hypothetical protein
MSGKRKPTKSFPTVRNFALRSDATVGKSLLTQSPTPGSEPPGM